MLIHHWYVLIIWIIWKKVWFNPICMLDLFALSKLICDLLLFGLLLSLNRYQDYQFGRKSWSVLSIQWIRKIAGCYYRHAAMGPTGSVGAWNLEVQCVSSTFQCLRHGRHYDLSLTSFCVCSNFCHVVAITTILMSITRPPTKQWRMTAPASITWYGHNSSPLQGRYKGVMQAQIMCDFYELENVVRVWDTYHESTIFFHDESPNPLQAVWEQFQLFTED